MNAFRLAAVLMLTTAAIFACSDDDDTNPGPVGGNPGAGGEPAAAGSANVGGGKGGSDQSGGATQGGATQGGAAQGGEQSEGGASAETSGGSGGASAAGAAQGGAGGEGAVACENEFDSSEGGEGGSGGSGADELELVGHYVDDFGFDVDIGRKLWNSSGIIEYDNDTNVVYTQYACDDQYNPNKFAKIVYTEPALGVFYYCMIEYNAGSLAAAKASTKLADESALDTNGCGGFPWSKAMPE